jgi:catechol 2,3-dioxygenase-like lactoylglutathione lyase family enzyme
MAIVLDHTIVPSNDRIAGAAFLGSLFDLEPESKGHFEALRINDQLTFDYETASRVDPQHYAFLVSDEEFDAIFDRILAQGIQYGSGPFSSTDGTLNDRRGGRGVYFSGGPDPHLYEIMTVAETGT